MKGLVDKSIGIVTRIPEALARIKPTEPLRLDKREARQKRNCSDSSGNSPVKILVSRTCVRKTVVQSARLFFLHDCFSCKVHDCFEGTIRLRSTKLRAPSG
jgi:hypothetical protein